MLIIVESINDHSKRANENEELQDLEFRLRKNYLWGFLIGFVIMIVVFICGLPVFALPLIGIFLLIQYLLPNYKPRKLGYLISNRGFANRKKWASKSDMVKLFNFTIIDWIANSDLFKQEDVMKWILNPNVHSINYQRIVRCYPNITKDQDRFLIFFLECHFYECIRQKKQKYTHSQ